jgi:hypothetical protein
MMKTPGATLDTYVLNPERRHFVGRIKTLFVLQKNGKNGI